MSESSMTTVLGYDQSHHPISCRGRLRGLSASMDSRDRHRRRMFAFLFVSYFVCVVDMDIENIIVRVKEIASAVSIPVTTVIW